MQLKRIDITALGGFVTRNPNAFAAVSGRRKNKATGDRSLNRSKYDPHQGAAETSRRLRRKEAA